MGDKSSVLALLLIGGSISTLGGFDLAFASKKAPSPRAIAQESTRLKRQVVLLEQHAKRGNWAKYGELVRLLKVLEMPLDSPDYREIEKILIKLKSKLGREHRSKLHLTPLFKETVALYLKFFPESRKRVAIMESGIAAESDTNLKLAQLQTWLHAERFHLTPTEELRIRRLRASIAEKDHRHEIVVEEMFAMISLEKKHEKKREFQYLMARAYYAQKKIDEALPLLQDLADPRYPNRDSWGLKGQNLALTILGQKKDYSALSAQAELWLREEGRDRNPKLVASLPQMRQALRQIASDWEKAGLFVDSARLVEKLAMPSQRPAREFLKAALLYDLAGEKQEQDRILKEMLVALQAKRSLGSEENSIYQALKSARLLRDSLPLPWSKNKKQQIATDLEKHL